MGSSCVNHRDKILQDYFSILSIQKCIRLVGKHYLSVWYFIGDEVLFPIKDQLKEDI